MDERNHGREGGRREQINCSLAENTTASLLQSFLLALTPYGMEYLEVKATLQMLILVVVMSNKFRSS